MVVKVILGLLSGVKAQLTKKETMSKIATGVCFSPLFCWGATSVPHYSRLKGEIVVRVRPAGDPHGTEYKLTSKGAFVNGELQPPTSSYAKKFEVIRDLCVREDPRVGNRLVALDQK